MSAPSFLRVFDRSNGVTRVSMGDELVIESAVAQHLETGRDAWLHLTTVEDAPCRMLASTIVQWMPSTPEIRSRNRVIERALEREDKSRKVKK